MTAPWDRDDFRDCSVGEDFYDESGFATGGLLPPRGDDDKLLVPLDCGYVLSAREVRALGHPWLAMLNDQLAQD